MSEFTCRKRSDVAFFFFFCYFCLKAGADRSGVRGTRQKKQFYSTVLGFHHITKKGEKQANGCSVEKERPTHKGFI